MHAVIRANGGETLRVLSWNTDGLNETRLGQRMEKLCLEILIGGDLAGALAGEPTPPMPDVVALQEVVRVAQRGYFAPHFGAAGFTLWPDGPPGDGEYWELLAVRPPWIVERAERRPFADSPLGRACTVARLRRGESKRRVTVMTAHMESLRSGREPRLSQTREIDAWMRAERGPVVFAGDTNLRDREWAEVKGELALRDAFVEAGEPASARFTWRPDEESRGFRFDRLCLAGGLRTVSFRSRSCPRGSDHEGVEATLGFDGSA